MATRDVVTRGPSVRFQLLDPLRGLAALWVFAFHYPFPEQFAAAFPGLLRIFRVGQLGVPMFFVISGYCLMGAVRLSLRHHEPVSGFLYRRSRRIYPPYWCSLVVVALVPFVIEGISALKTGTFVAPTAEGNLNLAYLRFGIADWFRVATLTQVFAHVDGAPNLQAKFTTINAVYWTLAIEFQFYLVMAVALWLRSRAVMWLGLVTLVALPLWYMGTWNLSGIFLPYWPMFATGIGLYLLIERGNASGAVLGAGHAWLAPAAVTLLTAAFVLRTVRGIATPDLVFASGFVVVLWCLHGFDSRYEAALNSGRPVTRRLLGLAKFLGLMSYSLYLLHGRVQFLAHQLVRQVISPGFVLDFGVIVVTCAMCAVFYWYCERPFIASRGSGSAARKASVPDPVRPTPFPALQGTNSRPVS